MTSAPMPRSSDLEVLHMLDLREGEGMSMKEVAEATGQGRSSVIGKVNRALSADLPCACTKPENKDGGMPRGWWR